MMTFKQWERSSRLHLYFGFFLTFVFSAGVIWIAWTADEYITRRRAHILADEIHNICEMRK